MSKTPAEEWTRRYIQLCKEVATWSKDPSTKVGAIVVGADPRQAAPLTGAGLADRIAGWIADEVTRQP